MPVRNSGFARTVQTLRQNAGAVGATVTVDVVCTWPTSFGDTNYTVAATLNDTVATANNNALRQVFNKTATTVTVRISSGASAYTSGQLLIELIGIHD